jgi:hypothetical protein
MRLCLRWQSPAISRPGSDGPPRAADAARNSLRLSSNWTWTKASGPARTLGARIGHRDRAIPKRGRYRGMRCSKRERLFALKSHRQRREHHHTRSHAAQGGPTVSGISALLRNSEARLAEHRSDRNGSRIVATTGLIPPSNCQTHYVGTAASGQHPTSPPISRP